MYLDIEKYTHHDFPTNPSIIIRFFSAHNRNIPNMEEFSIPFLRIYMFDAVDMNIATMMTSSSGNIFRITNHLCGEFTGHRWNPHTNASDAELWYFLRSAPEWTVE